MGVIFNSRVCEKFHGLICYIYPGLFLDTPRSVQENLYEFPPVTSVSKDERSSLRWLGIDGITSNLVEISFPTVATRRSWRVFRCRQFFLPPATDRKFYSNIKNEYFFVKFFVR